MKVRTTEILAALGLLTYLSLVVERMEFSLLPSMRFGTLLHLAAPFVIAGDKSATLPRKTKILLILKEIRLPSEILPIVGIRALRLIMILVHGTPLCLEEEQEEVHVLGQVLDQSHLEIVVAMGEGAVVAIVALVGVVAEVEAELSFVLLLVIEPLGPVMGTVASIVLRTSVGFLVFAEFGGEIVVVATLILE